MRKELASAAIGWHRKKKKKKELKAIPRHALGCMAVCYNSGIYT